MAFDRSKYKKASVESIDETVGLGMNAKNEEFRNQYVGKKVDHFQQWAVVLDKAAEPHFLI